LLGHLYRYPHPRDATKYIYSGQGAKRDAEHRRGRTSFGRRFKTRFPGAALPQPTREEVEVADQLELNELETISMFRYHTWHGYEDGMNLTLPGAQDYKNMGKIGGRIGGPIGGRIVGRIQGRKNVENGNLARIQSLGGRTHVESGHLARISKLPQTKAARQQNGRVAGRKAVESGQLANISSLGGRKIAESGLLVNANCVRWNIRRGKACTCGKHENKAA
jgi:hypothetical protein